jgi:RNA polymerase sigma-70 factor (ECF subfamily)
MSTTTGEPREGDRAPLTDGSTSRSMLTGAQQDEPAAWTRLVALYAPLVTAWCRRWGVVPQDVTDVVQDVFAAVARNVARFRKEQPQDSFRGWLATITRNKVRDYFRGQGEEPSAAGGTEAWQRFSQVCDPLDDESVSECAEEDAAFGELLRRALESIRVEFHERTWQAFWRTVVEGQSAAEAGAELAMQPGTVRVAKSRVLWRLRKELGEA